MFIPGKGPESLGVFVRLLMYTTLIVMFSGFMCILLLLGFPLRNRTPTKCVSVSVQVSKSSQRLVSQQMD